MTNQSIKDAFQRFWEYVTGKVDDHNKDTAAHSDIRSAVSGNMPKSGGTFAGQVVAASSAQTPGTSLLRNSKLVTSESYPSNNGEINWMYE